MMMRALVIVKAIHVPINLFNLVSTNKEVAPATNLIIQ